LRENVCDLESLTKTSVIRALAERHGFSFSKRLGQNFLINPDIVKKIAESGVGTLGEGVKAGVLEIGPGIGTLTRELAQRADKVAAVEIDGRLISVLEDTLSDFDNTAVINGDIMKLDLEKLIREHFGGLEAVVCANLPYYITSPVMMKLLESRLPIKAITAMVQKEAGIRLCAPLGTREAGAVTVAVRYFSEPKMLFNVSRGNFMPPPNVDSCVIRLDLRDSPPLSGEEEKLFFKISRGAFSQRRKTLANSLSAALDLDKRLVTAALNDAGLPESIRPENLLMKDFIKLTEIFKNV